MLYLTSSQSPGPISDVVIPTGPELPQVTAVHVEKLASMIFWARSNGTCRAMHVSLGRRSPGADCNERASLHPGPSVKASFGEVAGGSCEWSSSRRRRRFFIHFMTRT